MRLLNTIYPDPSLNLALEEAVLDNVESCASPDTLRIWESPVPFIVLGVAQIAAQETFLEHCLQDNIPLLRRCTAGGCVLQGPGCLNYSLTLSIASDPRLATIHGAYHYALDPIANALEKRGLNPTYAGICDLALGDAKFSGNAQRRKKNALLVHGTLLHNPDTPRMARYLREPQDRPGYRHDRDHANFVCATGLPPQSLRQALIEAFALQEAPTENPTQQEQQATQQLAQKKYRCNDWTFRR